MSADHQGTSGVMRRKGSFLRTVRAVAWAFLGLRKASEYQQDLERINPLHLIVVGLLGFLVLVLGLVGIVHWVA